MALTFPRDLPSCRYMRSEFVPQYFTARQVSGGGLPYVIELAPPLWKASWTVDALTREEGDVWEAWLHSMRGGLRTFKGAVPKHRWPKAYPRGFAGLTVGITPFSGIGVLSSIGAERDTLTIASVPVGFLLGVGDYLSLWVGNRQHLHRVVEAGTANGSGVVTAGIEPPLRPNATTGVAVRFQAPYCEMVLAGDWTSSRNGNQVSIQFSAVQVLTPSSVTPPDEMPPTITSAASVSVLENALLAHALTANETVTWSIVGGVDAARFEVSGSTLRWVGNGTQNWESPTDANGDNAYIVHVRATDTAGNITDQAVTVTVTNVADFAVDMLANEAAGLAIDFTDQSAAIKVV